MDDYTVLDIVNPTPDQVRAWGYREDHLFMEQDEDILLYDPIYASTLMDLMADKGCPKQEYVASILHNYATLLLSRRDLTDAHALAALSTAPAQSDAPLVASWRNRFLPLYDRLIHPRRFLDNEEMGQVAWELLVGPYGDLATFERVSDSTPELVVYQAFTVNAYQRFLVVDRETGLWRVSINSFQPFVRPASDCTG
jgi:hypothetical protein